MAGGNERASTYTAASGESVGRNGDQKRNLWTSMLESVASGKKLPEKNILVLGGTPESQREFLESLSGTTARRSFDRQKMPPIANNFALGYTYYDVLDADQEDTLARVSLYLLSQPSTEFAPLVSPLLTAETVPNTTLVILLDWSQPHLWLRQLWNWIQVLEQVMSHVKAEARNEMEEVMASWKERGRGGATINLDGTPSTTGTTGDGDGLLPLGPGEWTEPLGLPLSVVCQNAQKMEFLEKSMGWKEPDFDTVLQYLRTVLLRHGASLIYTSQNTTSQLPVLLHSTLGITSLLKRQPLKHNVIDRDKIVVAPNWDSWGKIRILGGTFDAELVSSGWEEDIKLPAGSKIPTMEDDGAIAQYEYWCRDPHSGGLAVVESAMGDGSAVGVESEDPQEFFERQLKILEAFRSKAPEKATENTVSTGARRSDPADEKSVNDHIGPVQFNMGGIQVDADDMLQRLKDRNARVASSGPDESDDENPVSNMAKEIDTEQLQNFFSGLMNRTAGSMDGPRS
ncbi:dynein light intermediate chain (DLIC) domain-containing protein [Hirsutella rhossiliensis]|uniref:Dynein light intermediate chain (DLIC) domain-containing protein n=1 Tax=Hirsutella rhossiliensis TaxID=111463 RepID=A0A9P8MNS8_9HYPO|nr:dynein light intermediate chain (DLIC) domain-containing protein [Hirsutella rhossiliensis]KAH0958404.1 dynein light intermediate chain (DLIC) domain-containing protein [Hirsutella rhossiliensis]